MITLQQLESAMLYVCGIDAEIQAKAVITRLLSGVDGHMRCPKNTLGIIARACQVECGRGPVNWALTFEGVDGCRVILQTDVHADLR
jgi:hypothetical protein